MRPRLLHLRAAALLATVVCAAEASAGGTIRIVNQAQIPVASVVIRSSEMLRDKPILSGRSLDVPVAAGRSFVNVGVGFGVREVFLAGVRPSGSVTVGEGETVRLVVPRLNVRDVLARGRGGDPAFPYRPNWSGGGFTLTFSPSGEWFMSGPGTNGKSNGMVTEVSWPDQSTSITFRLNDKWTTRIDRPYTSFYLTHANLDRPLVRYVFDAGIPPPGWQ